MDENVKTGLVTKVNAEFGKALIEEAVKQNQENAKRLVTGRVQEMIRELQAQRDLIEQAHSNTALLESRLKAVEAGEFTLEKNGDISFTDKDLHKPILTHADCSNCGFLSPTRIFPSRF